MYAALIPEQPMGHRACDKGAGSFGDVLDGNASGTTQDLSGDLQRHAVIPSREKKAARVALGPPLYITWHDMT